MSFPRHGTARLGWAWRGKTRQGKLYGENFSGVGRFRPESNGIQGFRHRMVGGNGLTRLGAAGQDQAGLGSAGHGMAGQDKAREIIWREFQRRGQVPPAE
jgi:hypothetical protein